MGWPILNSTSAQVISERVAHDHPVRLRLVIPTAELVLCSVRQLRNRRQILRNKCCQRCREATGLRPKTLNRPNNRLPQLGLRSKLPLPAKRPTNSGHAAQRQEQTSSNGDCNLRRSAGACHDGELRSVSGSGPVVTYEAIVISVDVLFLLQSIRLCQQYRSDPRGVSLPRIAMAPVLSFMNWEPLFRRTGAGTPGQ